MPGLEFKQLPAAGKLASGTPWMRPGFAPSGYTELESGSGGVRQWTTEEDMVRRRWNEAGERAGIKPPAEIAPWFREPRVSAPPDSPEFQVQKGMQELRQDKRKLSMSAKQKMYQGLLQKRSEMTLVQQMVDLGKINPAAGQQAKWKLVLGPEAEAAMFPSASAGAMPFAPSTLKGYEEDIKNTYMGGGDAPWYKGGFGMNIKTQNEALDIYKQWQTEVGYWHPRMGQTRRIQLDKLWDAQAGKMPSWKWDSTSGAVKAARSPQRGLTGAISRKIHPGQDKSPIGRAIIRQSKPVATGLSPTDKQALDWAKQNPTDPRAAAILQKLGAK